MSTVDRPLNLTLALLGLAGLSGGVALAAPTIRPTALSDHVRTLASDDFGGREPGTPGEKLSVDYISRQFAAAGLKPGGDLLPDGRRSWTQTVPIEEYSLSTPIDLSIDTDGRKTTLVQRRDIVVGSRADLDRVDIKNAPLVFAGYGVDAPEKQWDDFKGADLTGKIALVLINDPDFRVDLDGRFDGPVMTYYGRWDYKFSELARRGARGILIIHDQKASGGTWAGWARFFGLPQLDLQSTARTSKNAPVEGWITREQAVRLFAAEGMDLDAEQQRASSPDFRPIDFRRSRFSAHFGLQRRNFDSRNVIGRVDGSTAPDESVIFSAHWDHLGHIDGPDGRKVVAPGAQDNAGGIAGLIELGRVFAAAPPRRRSLLFVAFTAEEKGLLGSAYFAEHPTTLLRGIVADINIDALDIKGATRDISLWGNGRSGLEPLLGRVAKAAGRTLVRNPRFDDGYYFRSDHFSFARLGVPGVTLGSGLDLHDGGPAAGKTQEDDYFDNRYHGRGDAWSPDLDFSGLATDIDLLVQFGRALSETTDRPMFEPGSAYFLAQSRLLAQPAKSEAGP
ncbi:hypothetical protein ASD39_01620 [Sphingomonas sp. Root50]|nr:hypothetical protein ASD17_00425 [Sphingomonas sp. Root1294]KQY69038.1 hypothetical protein ASD39_01620 [Sphingomonas sp. Root50]KRB89293.1 hypothetical protein ASE22_16535 [Sphingomonas sp. Root720]